MRSASVERIFYFEEETKETKRPQRPRDTSDPQRPRDHRGRKTERPRDRETERPRDRETVG